MVRVSLIDQRLAINVERFKTDFDILSQIGATSNDGVHRPALSQNHLKARAWFRERVKDADLVFQIDQAGNHSAILPCQKNANTTLLIGSHLDSVPYGGRFDGALGVLAALEILRVINENNINMPINLEAIDFTDEEGTLVNFMGSFALAGKLDKEGLDNPRGGRKEFENGLNRAGLAKNDILDAQRNPNTLAGYLELHVEQGPRLERAGADIGVVSSIAGISSYHVKFIGREDHAATIPMNDRLDAGLGASAFTLAAHQLVLRNYPECYVNIGSICYEPGNFNIVPRKATASLEFRAPNSELMQHLRDALIKKAKHAAEEHKLGIEIELLGDYAPAAMDEQLQELIVSSADYLGLRSLSLRSGPGHDAQAFADLCPTGMIFAPSINGASHSPREKTSWNDCVNSANVLLRTTLQFINSKL
jgi:N-carbamoyl-L-amino-acid hydrolase